jgi:hypothetical protein
MVECGYFCLYSGEGPRQDLATLRIYRLRLVTDGESESFDYQNLRQDLQINIISSTDRSYGRGYGENRLHILPQK